ncbi:hypothetical protein P154DRAFT_495217 [Amniculicola lignicola CBS 123094]|uniref:MYND-type domain-containing protein n=1 Tax=Amniculicola lignicola CBS 123094 TaxID=1392246 RepID=A0A6A5WEG3_9PLEO|nr:hypothetical protein P154DRAFT_495217 [Amniculicola lignicola CBS 123094]
MKPCHKAAGLACGSCKLVQYCSKECQKAHWREHKVQCKSPLMQPKYVPAWVREGRTPRFIDNDAPFVSFGQRRFLWGNVPALDIMKMKDNEGLKDLGRDISLLFAASGDCRNVIKTIISLPEGYTGRCTAVLNDRDFAVVARNVILLLSALHFDPGVSAPVMIHLWYSALIPAIMLETLQREILPYIEDVCAKVKGKSAKSIQAKTFNFSNGSLRLLLKKEQWFQLASFFKVPKGLTCESAAKLRVQTTLNPDRKDHLDRALYTRPPGQRKGCWKFRAEGILLPFGCSTKEFDMPNPTLFQELGEWPMTDSADPLNGWLHAEYMPHATIAKADVYGSLFFFLRDLFLKFCNRVHKTSILFHLYNMDARELPEYLLPGGRAFDRIEIANTCDRGYIGPEITLSTFAPLLQPKAQNPKATLLMLFLNATGEKENQLGNLYGTADLPRRMKRLLDLIGPDTDIMTRIAMGDETVKNDPEFLRRSNLHNMFANFDELFDLFSKDVRMNDLAKANRVKTKRQHSLIEKWPYRVTKSTSRNCFDIMCASSLSGWERYVEFERAE